MAYKDYMKALKLGEKAYKDSIDQGKSPYLPVLDEILTHADIEYEIPLGVSYIPLEQVVGTATRGRTTCFSSNFMPLMQYETEFGAKWASLYNSQLEEGIRDAVKVYEYMNKYYVLEGNKRVSVLKFLDCPIILADVVRKVPKKSDEPEIRIYYEYMDFYELTKISDILFSHTGRYAKLLSAVSETPDIAWTKEMQQDFSIFYGNFYKAFVSLGGPSLKQVTNGDALLFYLTLYPYDISKDASTEEIRSNLMKIWSDVVLMGDKDAVELLMDPEKGRGFISSMFNRIRPSRRKRIAFIYDKSPSCSNWNYGHELGRLHLQQTLKEAVETYAFVAPDPDEGAEKLLEDICAEGCDIIFAASPILIRACLKAAVAHPEVIILNCSLNSSCNTVRTYHARMYEAKFLTGMIAGSLCANDKIGYIADYPIYSAAASINAFSLGVKMVNPRAKVHLTWSTLKDFPNCHNFEGENIYYISDQDIVSPENENRNFGLYQKDGEGKTNLAMSVYNWGVFYEKLVKNILYGSWKSDEVSENKAINYWWGLSAGVIDVLCSKHLPADTAKLIELMKKNIASGDFHPLSGPLIQQGGHVHYHASEVMKPEDIMRMDWLVDNVVGSIPTVDMLREEAQPVVMLRGLYAVTAKQGGSSFL